MYSKNEAKKKDAVDSDFWEMKKEVPTYVISRLSLRRLRDFRLKLFRKIKIIHIVFLSSYRSNYACKGKRGKPKNCACLYVALLCKSTTASVSELGGRNFACSPYSWGCWLSKLLSRTTLCSNFDPSCAFICLLIWKTDLHLAIRDKNSI